MKAARLQAYGDTDQFKLEDAPDPVAGDGQVVIEVAASGLNPVDTMVRKGFLAGMVPLELPAILGIDAAGTVLSVGPGAEGFKVGDRVIAYLPISGPGAHAEKTVVPVDALAHLADSVGFEAGATLPLAAITGRQAVDALGVQAADTVLVSGALGAVGRAAVQYLKELGAKPVAGVRETRLDEGRALAGDAVDIGTVPATPMFDYAISCAAPVAGNVVKYVRDGGKLANAVQMPEDANPGDRINVIAVMAHNDAKMLQDIADAAGRGDLVIPVAARFTLAELGEAHAALDAGPAGKIIITG